MASVCLHKQHTKWLRSTGPKLPSSVSEVCLFVHFSTPRTENKATESPLVDTDPNQKMFGEKENPPPRPSKFSTRCSAGKTKHVETKTIPSFSLTTYCIRRAAEALHRGGG